MKIRNWKKFQHFKDRRPPWIRLYREILDQRDINVISDRAFRVLIGLWLLASEAETLDGALPPVEDIAFRLRMPVDRVTSCIDELSNFLYQDDIKMISNRYQVDAPEAEAEAEAETDILLERIKVISPVAKIPLVNRTEHHITQEQVDQFSKAYPAVDIHAELEKIRAWCIANPTKRKTPKGVMRFVNSWLGRCQDRGGNGKQPQQAPIAEFRQCPVNPGDLYDN